MKKHKKKYNYMSGLGESATLGITGGVLTMGMGKAGIPTTAMTGITPFLKPMATIGATGTTLHISKKMFKELKKLK